MNPSPKPPGQKGAFAWQRQPSDEERAGRLRHEFSSCGLRVKGLLSTGYAGQYGQPNRNYAQGDLTFRCNVDYRGAVTNIRIDRNSNYRRY